MIWSWNPTKAQVEAALAVRGDIMRAMGDGDLADGECSQAVKNSFGSAISDSTIKSECEDLQRWLKITDNTFVSPESYLSKHPFTFSRFLPNLEVKFDSSSVAGEQLAWRQRDTEGYLRTLANAKGLAAALDANFSTATMKGFYRWLLRENLWPAEDSTRAVLDKFLKIADASDVEDLVAELEKRSGPACDAVKAELRRADTNKDPRFAAVKDKIAGLCPESERTRTTAGSGVTCFPAGTFVFAEGGEAVAIEDVKVGQRIAGLDEGGRVVYQTVAGIKAHSDAGRLLNIAYRTATGARANLAVTANHPLADCSGPLSYMTAEAFVAGGLLCGGAPGTGQIESVGTAAPYTGKLYDLSIAGGSHNYFVSPTPDFSQAIVGHNKWM